MLKKALIVIGWSTIFLAIIVTIFQIGLSIQAVTIGSIWMKMTIGLGYIYELISRMAIGLLCLFAATKIES